MGVGEDVLRILLFADDLVLFAEDDVNLQKMLEVLQSYSQKWRFEINVGKSNVMVCAAKSLLEGENGTWH